MRRVKFNAIVNTIGFVAFAVLAVTVLGLGRHDWGDIHNVAGVVMLAIVALHLILHWRWGRRDGRRRQG